MVERLLVPLQLRVALLEQLEVVRKVLLELANALLRVRELALLVGEQTVERLDAILVNVVQFLLLLKDQPAQRRWWRAAE